MGIDWQQVVLNLRSYAPLSRVAKELGIDWQALNRLVRGETAEPRFETGLRLLDLHEKVCKSRHSLEFIGR